MISSRFLFSLPLIKDEKANLECDVSVGKQIEIERKWHINWASPQTAFVKTARSTNQTGSNDVIPCKRYLQSRFLLLNHVDDGTANRYENIMDVGLLSTRIDHLFITGILLSLPVNRDILCVLAECGQKRH